jgi:hypothetical protein
MSRLLARSAATTALFVLVACAQIANIEAGDPQTSVSGSTGGSSSGGPASGAPEGSGAPGTTSGNPSVPSDGGGGGGADAADAAPPPPVCVAPKKPNDQSCAAGSECCSDACNEDGKCHDKCRTNDFCDPFGNDCCLGMYCPVSIPFRCKTCLGAGEEPEDNLKKSCCSRDVNGAGKCK